MIDTIATVESNFELAPGYKVLTLDVDEAIATRAGQFAMLKAHNAFEPLLRRALAIYKAESQHRFRFLYQVLGRGTQALSILEKGGKVDVLLPLGNSWLAETADPANESTKSVADTNPPRLPDQAIVVAGGIGSASVLMLCEELQRAKVSTRIFFGAASESVAIGCGLDEFRTLDSSLTLTTDDGSLGERGFVTAPLERYLRDGAGVGATIYTCGPWVMMRRVAEIAEHFDVACLASLEAPMGCGFGVCVGCVVAVRGADPNGYGAYKRVCMDGSVFPAETVRWDVAAMTH